MTPKPHPQADEAARYVLDQLSPPARHEFELQLTQSAELRALVQELEEGAEAIARAVPQRPPPPQTWNPIEQAIAREVERKIVRPSFGAMWWRSGWAAAAACLVAFLAYAWWPKSKPAGVVNPGLAEVSQAVPSQEPIVSNPALARPEPVFPTNVMTVAELKPPIAVTSPELASLRWQIASMQAQLEQLSDVVAQQRAILAEPGRFKFFPLSGSTGEAGAAGSAPLSPGLQRAMFYAMARDMGWLPSLTTRETPGRSVSASAKTFAGVDFVDLNATTMAPTSSAEASAATTDSTAQADSAPVSVASSGGIGIPGVLTKKDLILALDKTIIPRGGAVSFWKASDLTEHELIGSTVINDNPTVVKIPIDQIGAGMTVSLSSFSGPSNIGSFHIVRPANPGLSQPTP